MAKDLIILKGSRGSNLMRKVFLKNIFNKKGLQTLLFLILLNP
jgi:hypothetical protein